MRQYPALHILVILRKHRWSHMDIRGGRKKSIHLTNRNSFYNDLKIDWFTSESIFISLFYFS